MLKLRQEKEIDELKECTFQPNKENKEKKNKTKKFNLDEVIDKLYKDGLKKINEKKSEIKKREEQEKTKECVELTEKPVLSHL